MSSLERLRQAIDRQQSRLRSAVPADRQVAILALLDTQDRQPRPPDPVRAPDVVTGRRMGDLGWNKALRLCLEADGGAEMLASVSSSPVPPDAAMDGWRTRFLDECGRVSEAELVLAHCETGFMLLTDDGHGAFDAWIATKRVPTTWRERADVDWWAGWLARHHEPELRALQSERPDRTLDVSGRGRHHEYQRRVAAVHLKMMAYQIGYPADAAIHGCTIQTYRDILEELIGRALLGRDRGETAVPQSESSLIATLASALGKDPTIVERAVSAFTLDRENAAYHAAVPGIAAAPMVRIAPDRIVWSLHGLTSEPLLFLVRELRRRAGQEYHNSAHLREGVFRRDLYTLFQDRRFVTSLGRIELRREAGDIRTDIDAVIFDRKSGALGIFELKSQDPFARSAAELARQRDNVLYANRQVSGALAWLQRPGPDALLARVDARTAKTFRAQKVYPFVLGRYLAHFIDGPEPDRRAAWGTWPQLLRLLDGQPVRASDANPLASLFSRISKDNPRIGPPAEGPSREIPVGDAYLRVHPSYAAVRTGATGERRT